MASHLIDTEALMLLSTVLSQSRDGSQFAFRSLTGLQASAVEAASNQTVEQAPTFLAESSGNLIYAGYPYDPYK